MDECAGASSLPPPANFERYLQMFHGRLSVQLRCCAIVGSSSILMGKGLGSEIDAFDTVIRVNRLPIPDYFDDYGRRTDIAFVNDHFWLRPQVPEFGYRKGANARNCTEPGECNFTVILSSWLPNSQRNWSEIQEAWKTVQAPVGHESQDVGDWIRGYLPLSPSGSEHYMPSGGLHAFFTFAPLCSYTRLYGFGGVQNGNIDNHSVGDYHSFADERRVMGLINQGNTTKLKMLLKKAKRKRRSVPEWLQKRLGQVAGRIRTTSA